MSLTDELISFWELEESSGTRFDAHGSHDLVDNNTVGQGTGKVGNCADLYSSNSEYLSHSNTPELATGDIDFTIAAWANLRSTGGSPRIAAKGRWTTQREWGLYYTGSRFVFYISADGDNVYDVVEAYDFGAVSLNTWYLVVAWHDETEDTMNIQVNNGTVDSHATGGDAPAKRLGLFSIGSEYGYGLFNGMVDQVGFWKRVLTSEERTRLYNNGAGLTYDALDFPKPPAEALKTVILTPSIGLYDTRIKLRAKARDTFLTTRVRNQ
ncbi:MAG: LamG domain-containing protein [Chloroflexi bacterium]|nr:LamG domain-containing protein [Chloroflexota bacterium]